MSTWIVGVARLVVAFLGMVAVLALWILFFVVTMWITLYIMKLFPLTGQWRKRIKAWLQ